MKSSPTVSVVVATRNRSDLLPVALRSIRDQSFSDYEVLVVDDGSDAATLAQYPAMWKRLELDERFRLQGGNVADLPGTGPAASRNRGLCAARGTFVAFCDDDDHWCAADHLATAISAMRTIGARLFIANMRGESDGQVTIPDWFPACRTLRDGPRIADNPVIHCVSRRRLMRALRHHYAHPNGIVVARDLIEQAGGFWDRLRHAEDINLVLRLADRCPEVLFRPDPAVAFNVSPIAKSYSSAGRVEHQLVLALAGDHVSALAAHPETRCCARAITSWALRNVARHLVRDARWRSSLHYAWRALQIKPTTGAMALVVEIACRAVWGALVRTRHRPSGGED